MIKQVVFTKETSLHDEEKLKSILSTSSPIIQFKEQLHGTEHLFVERDEYRDGDILVTQKKQNPLLIRTADCLSIMIFDPVTHTIANIHAGWKGLAARVVREALHVLRSRAHTESKNCIAFMSPSIGPCCYQFIDARSKLPKHLHQFITEEETLNIWGAAEMQLKESGIMANNIENKRICTYCHPELYYSYRRGDRERFGSAIMMI